MPKIYQSPSRYKATELRTYYAPYFVTRSLTPTIGAAVPTFTRSGTAMWLDNTGTFQSAPANTPRFEYEYNATTGLYESVGLLIEGNGQTNLRTWSNDFSNATYNYANAAQSSSLQGPLGTAFAISASATNSSHLFAHNISTTNGSSYTYSVMAKANGVTSVMLWAEGSSVKMKVDLLSGTVTSNVGTTYTKIKNLGNGWFHCFMAFTSAATTGINAFRLYIGSTFSIILGKES